MRGAACVMHRHICLYRITRRSHRIFSSIWKPKYSCMQRPKNSYFLKHSIIFFNKSYFLKYLNSAPFFVFLCALGVVGCYLRRTGEAPSPAIAGCCTRAASVVDNLKRRVRSTGISFIDMKTIYLKRFFLTDWKLREWREEWQRGTWTCWEMLFLPFIRTSYTSQ